MPASRHPHELHLHGSACRQGGAGRDPPTIPRAAALCIGGDRSAATSDSGPSASARVGVTRAAARQSCPRWRSAAGVLLPPIPPHTDRRGSAPCRPYRQRGQRSDPPSRRFINAASSSWVEAATARPGPPRIASPRRPHWAVRVRWAGSGGNAAGGSLHGGELTLMFSRVYDPIRGRRSASCFRFIAIVLALGRWRLMPPITPPLPSPASAAPVV